MSFLNTLTLIFIVLKLVHVITWSWGLVLLPTISYIIGYILFFGLIIALKIWAELQSW